MQKKEKQEKTKTKTKYPALCLSGGMLTKCDKILEFRLWIHPQNRETYFFCRENLLDLLFVRERELQKDHFSVEPLLALVRRESDVKSANGDKYRENREVCIPGLDRK